MYDYPHNVITPISTERPQTYFMHDVMITPVYFHQELCEQDHENYTNILQDFTPYQAAFDFKSQFNNESKLDDMLVSLNICNLFDLDQIDGSLLSPYKLWADKKPIFMKNKWPLWITFYESPFMKNHLWKNNFLYYLWNKP